MKFSEYNLIAVKLRLTPNYTMGLPIRLSSQLGGDFVGDNLAFHLVPETIKDEVFEKLSPRNVLLYLKSLQPIIVPSHEFLNKIGTHHSNVMMNNSLIAG